MKTRFPVLVAVLLAACAKQAPPRTRPEPPAAMPAAEPIPQTAPIATVAGTARDSSEQPVVARDTMLQASRDSIRVQTTDVAKRVAEVFGDSAVAALDSAAMGPSWDIDVRSYETTARVERYVRAFTGPSRERIQARLQKGTRYEPMIRAAMRAGGIPEDMYYLALVESGFDPNAYSRAAAVGMWQFMTSTAKDMGMRVDWWIDERRDPVRSTIAAVRFLRGLREQFGSLYLAAAAYNGGPGRISRGLSRYAGDLEGTTGEDLFFALAETGYLRNETREYVPQLIAAALIAKEPERYGMQITPEPPLEYDSVKVGPGTTIAAIAKAANTKTFVIKELNPQILRGMAPPRDSLRVRIPVGSSEGFAAALAELPKEECIGWRVVESKKGESVASIARRAGLSTKTLGQYNPKLQRLKSGNLVPGQAVLVPTAAAVGAAVNVPDPAIERWGTSSRSARMHVVKKGETLSGIAKRYRTTTAAIMRSNSMRKPLIFPGQQLAIPGTSQAAKPAAKKPVAVAAK
jgi:membrane-bound lytic murein transglycosylase D